MAERRQRPEDRGVGDQDIEPAPALVDRGAERVERLGLAQIEREGARRRAVSADLVIDLFERTDRPRQQDDMRALARHSERDGAAETARGTGDEGNAAGKAAL